VSVFVNTIARADHPAQDDPLALEEFALGEAPYDAQVTEVVIVPTEEIVVNDTDHRTFFLVNKGKDGTGTTVLAEICTEPETGPWPAMVEKVLPLTEITEDLKVHTGDMLAITEETTGAGGTHPDLQVSVRGTHS